MDEVTIEALKTRLRAAQSMVRAQVGAVDHPMGVVFDFLGFKFRPGERAIDTVTGQEVEICGGTIKNINTQNPGVVSDSGGVRETP